MSIASAHIFNKLDLFGCMLVRIGMKASGTVPEGFDRAIISAHLTIDVLPIGLIFHSGFGNAMILSKPD
ncbi:hypothetical protein [Sellimonas intestinalis]|uniref:hypothetical protein n=1 Tax=Sellimonas intestinalis TaxID=1653434 RepID=UPI001FAB8E51|nr:hypothetical protein [Sellimonas intestinalis]